MIKDCIVKKAGFIDKDLECFECPHWELEDCPKITQNKGRKDV